MKFFNGLFISVLLSLAAPPARAAGPFLLQNLEKVDQALFLPRDFTKPSLVVTVPPNCIPCLNQVAQWTRPFWLGERKDIQLIIVVVAETWRIARTPFLGTPQISSMWHDPGGRYVKTLSAPDPREAALFLFRAGGTEILRKTLRAPVQVGEIDERLKRP